jgi:hypothetical protein
VLEGENFLKNDPLYDLMDQNMDYIGGKQAILAQDPSRPDYIPRVVINETRRTVRRHVSALTDLKPVYAYKIPNPQFQTHGLLLNHLTTVWWINTFADLALADAAKYAAACGSGDLVLEYDPFFGPMGDMRMFARDPRDTLPIKPSRDGSIQSWFGCIIREEHSPVLMKRMYPAYRHLLEPDVPWGSGIFTKFKRSVARIMGSGSTLDGLNRTKTGGKTYEDGITLYRVYFNDASINTTAKPILMGQPGTSWSYLVQPGGRLYPRKRLIVCTEKVILFDGPNTYWHGMFPVSRLSLDRYPWSFFGLPLAGGNKTLQDTINRLLQDMLVKVQQKAHPAMVGNSRVPEHLLRGFDPRKPGAKLRTNEQMGTGFDTVKTEDLPAWTLDLWQNLRNVYHELTGDATLDALQATTARRLPDPDAIEAFMNALSPELKLEGRQVELCIREIAEMQKANIFQYYDAPRRMQILGDAGMTLQDFDYDPGNLIPAMKAGEQGYLPQLDVNNDQRDRAQFFLKLFSFYITPNSLLALNARSEQLKYMQLSRAGICDVWTLWEKLEIANAGKPPKMMLPLERPLTPEEEQAIAAATAAPQVDPMTGQPPVDPMTGLPAPAPEFPQHLTMDPMTGQMLELREPTTITERLQAQMMLGLGMSATPAGATQGGGGANPGGGGGGQPGRKAAGKASPRVEAKPGPGGSTRYTMSEANADHQK